MYHKFQHVLNDIEHHLNVGEPFSILRVGDGDLKLLWDIHYGKVNKQKFQRSGIPKDKAQFVIDIYRDGCNNANYTSSFDVYYTDKMWNRKFSDGTKIKVMNWKEVYKNIGIENDNFCSPEIGFLLFLHDVPNNLFNQMIGKKVCIITCYKNAATKLQRAGIDARTLLIPAVGKGHYKVYAERVKQLRKMVSRNKHDIYLNAAGALGKG